MVFSNFKFDSWITNNKSLIQTLQSVSQSVILGISVIDWRWFFNFYIQNIYIVEVFSLHTFKTFFNLPFLFETRLCWGTARILTGETPMLVNLSFFFGNTYSKKSWSEANLSCALLLRWWDFKMLQHLSVFFSNTFPKNCSWLKQIVNTFYPFPPTI